MALRQLASRAVRAASQTGGPASLAIKSQPASTTLRAVMLRAYSTGEQNKVPKPTKLIDRCGCCVGHHLNCLRKTLQSPYHGNDAVPDGIKYAESHEYAKIDGDVATLGITDFAQASLMA